MNLKKNTKEKLISGGITLKNRSVNFLDVEKTITNVTIKDILEKRDHFSFVRTKFSDAPHYPLSNDI
jgi:hypothetical protein